MNEEQLFMINNLILIFGISFFCLGIWEYNQISNIDNIEHDFIMLKSISNILFGISLLRGLYKGFNNLWIKISGFCFWTNIGINIWCFLWFIRSYLTNSYSNIFDQIMFVEITIYSLLIIIYIMPIIINYLAYLFVQIENLSDNDQLLDFESNINNHWII